MKKVVDANFLRNVALEDYFKADRKNLAVFTDYVCMECYKGSALSNIRRSLEIVSKYSEQVVILKGTRQIIGLQAGGNCASADFVDSKQTEEFWGFCRQVGLAVEGDRELTSRLVELGKIANAHFSRMRDDASGVSKAIQLISKTFSPNQLAELRKRGALSSETLDVVIRNVLALATFLFKMHPDVPNIPPADRLRDNVVFRFALATQLLVVRWLTDGGNESVPMKKLSNDIVDMAYVAYATMFDGILSNDRRLLDIHEEVVCVLRTVFAPDIDQPGCSSR